MHLARVLKRPHIEGLRRATVVLGAINRRKPLVDRCETSNLNERAAPPFITVMSAIHYTDSNRTADGLFLYVRIVFAKAYFAAKMACWWKLERCLSGHFAAIGCVSGQAIYVYSMPPKGRFDLGMFRSK